MSTSLYTTGAGSLPSDVASPSAGTVPVIHWEPGIEISYSDLVFGKKIGAGGFAEVYKGTYRGTDVAIKRLLVRPGTVVDQPTPVAGGMPVAATMADAAKAAADFRAEVSLMARLRHPNIVLLMGATSEPLCLVTEFCARGSLFDILHSPSITLDWKLRLNIALDAARGMAYLHSNSPPIIHR
jgi:serine/threonine protein kinase